MRVSLHLHSPIPSKTTANGFSWAPGAKGKGGAWGSLFCCSNVRRATMPIALLEVGQRTCRRRANKALAVLPELQMLPEPQFGYFQAPQSLSLPWRGVPGGSQARPPAGTAADSSRICLDSWQSSAGIWTELCPHDFSPSRHLVRQGGK